MKRFVTLSYQRHNADTSSAIFFDATRHFPTHMYATKNEQRVRSCAASLLWSSPGARRGLAASAVTTAATANGADDLKCSRSHGTTGLIALWLKAHTVYSLVVGPKPSTATDVTFFATAPPSSVAAC
ncbi:hypothetical protein EVAR_98833_1 [Eumeta japonica]|uniref:Uncharacterized protein n=1 Tax=Eumeta variegata TaxID=151549 RepID=A0A4C1YHV0_EUMVA|nr:hypothetical protein EVAR_98833_1 [Eumeta japonica]